LVVEDDEAMAELVATWLRYAGYEVEWVADAQAAADAARRRGFELLLVDYQLRGQTGLDVARAVEEVQRRRVPIIVMTANGNLEAAVAALRAGASDFLLKPFALTVLQAVVGRVLSNHHMRLELEALKSQVSARDATQGLLGRHRSMESVRALISRVASADQTVLVSGESGTGKELVAKALHERSGRAKKPLVAINCGALPATLLESELFGHVKGAFTDARTERLGVFREADGGTLFLDEVGELPLSLQASLLRVLQEKMVRPVGANRELPVDVRVVAATNRDLPAAVEAKTFRADLLFRLDVLRVEVPPLRERGDDVLLLASHFLVLASSRNGRPLTGWSPEVASRLLEHAWPGNVRELQNVIERAVLAADGPRLETWHLPVGLGERPPPKLEGSWPLVSLAELERRHIAHVLGAVGGNKQRAADLLGVDRVTLYRKLKRAT
jgi:two-component system response regulator HydG